MLTPTCNEFRTATQHQGIIFKQFTPLFCIIPQDFWEFREISINESTWKFLHLQQLKQQVFAMSDTELKADNKLQTFSE